MWVQSGTNGKEIQSSGGMKDFIRLARSPRDAEVLFFY